MRVSGFGQRVWSCEWGWMGVASECGVVRIDGCGQ